MAVNMSRSEREGLLEGATDGKYFKIRPDTVENPMNTQRIIEDREALSAGYNYGHPTNQVPLHQRGIPGT